MMEIYICEDDEKQLQRIKSHVENIIAFDEVDMHLSIASAHPQDILNAAGCAKGCGLYFLDIDLNNDTYDGFTLAQSIRQIEPRCFIVFITTHSEMRVKTFDYKVEPLDYLLKDDMDAMKAGITQCMRTAYERHSGGVNAFKKIYTVSIPGKRQISLNYEDIIGVQIIPGTSKVELRLTNRVLQYSAQLKDVAESLGNDFFRCHRSALIHLKNVKEVKYDENCIVMKDGSTYPLATREKRRLRMLMGK